jgi:hypothetical protein
MSESDDSSDTDLNESMSCIHSLVEKLSHESKKMYSKALKINALVENPELNIWTEEFHLNERAYVWAKAHLVPRKTTMWQIHRTLLESAKKDKRLSRGHRVKLSKEEADILELVSDEYISVWKVLGKLPKFFL